MCSRSRRASFLLAVFFAQAIHPSPAFAGDLGDFFKGWRFHRQAEGHAVEAGPPITWRTNSGKNYGGAVSLAQDSEHTREGLKKASRHLEKINSHIKEWGHAAASQFFLFPDQRETGGDQIGTPFGIGSTDTLNLREMSEKVRNSLQGAVSVLKEDATAVGGKLAVGQDELLGVAQANELLKQKAMQDRILSQSAVQRRENDANELQAQRALDSFREGTSPSSAAPTGFPAAPSNPGTNDVMASSIKAVDSTTNKPLEVTPPNPLLPAATDAAIDKARANSGFGPLNNPFGETTFKSQGSLLSRTSPSDPKDPATDLKGLGLSLSESDVLKIASSTVVTGKLLQTMSDPKGYSSDKQVFMAVTEVSVAPGTFTRRGYACEVHLRPQYAALPSCGECVGREKEHSSHKIGPQVFAAFPLADAQTLDLVFGDRHQFQLMLDIAAKAVTAGQTATANAMFNRIERMQRDVATRTPLPVIVPNSDGTMVSYRFEPSLRAVANPGSKSSQPDLVLPPMSIPALVVLVCDKDDLRKYPYLRLESSARWVPLEFRHWLKTWTIDWMWRGRRFTQTEPMDDRFEMAESMDWVHYYLDQARPWCGPGSNDHHSFREIETRLATLEPLLGHASLETKLPPAVPDITSIQEGEVNLDTENPRLVLQGVGFKRAGQQSSAEIVHRATVNSRPVSFNADERSVTLMLGPNAKDWLTTDFATVKLATISGEVEWKDIPVRRAKAKTPFHIVAVSPSKVEPDNATGTLKPGSVIAVVCSEKLDDKGTLITVDGVLLDFHSVKANVVFGKVPAKSSIPKGAKSVVVVGGDKVATLSNAIVIGSDAPPPEPVQAPQVLFPRKAEAYSVAKDGKIFVHGAHFKNLDNAATPAEQDAILQIIAQITGGTAAVFIDDNKKVFEMKIEGDYSKDKFVLPMLAAKWSELAKVKDNKPEEIKGDLNISLRFIWKDHSTGKVDELKDVMSFVVKF